MPDIHQPPRQPAQRANSRTRRHNRASSWQQRVRQSDNKLPSTFSSSCLHKERDRFQKPLPALRNKHSDSSQPTPRSFPPTPPRHPPRHPPRPRALYMLLATSTAFGPQSVHDAVQWIPSQPVFSGRIGRGYSHRCNLWHWYSAACLTARCLPLIAYILGAAAAIPETQHPK
jgi:hypothetical protein